MAGTNVKCYAGYRYPERPSAFLWQGDRMVVEEVEHSWRTPAGPVFRVRTAGGRRFVLAYDEASDVWDIQPTAGQRGEVI